MFTGEGDRELASAHCARNWSGTAWRASSRPPTSDRARHDHDDLGLVRLAALEALAVLAPTPEAGAVARELRGYAPLKYGRERIERLIAVVWPE